jgi:hypothetical protein
MIEREPASYLPVTEAQLRGNMESLKRNKSVLTAALLLAAWFSLRSESFGGKHKNVWSAPRPFI